MIPQYRIFFSWQSDNTEARDSLQQALDEVVKQLKGKGIAVQIEQGGGGCGFISIEDSVRIKIRRCDIFVGDVTPVGNVAMKGKLLPNANVMYEMGLATECMKADRILAVAMKGDWKVENMPFDFNHYTMLQYDPEKDLPSLMGRIKERILKTDKVSRRENNRFFSERVVNKNITSGKYLPETFLENLIAKEKARMFLAPHKMYPLVYGQITSLNFDYYNAETDSYTLTKQNVIALASCLLDMSFDSISYRLVTETECDEMIERVEENLGICLNDVFSAPESEKEVEETIIGILLSPKATEDEKIAYLRKQQNKIRIDALEQKEEKSLALKCDVIEPAWTSIIYYLNNVCEKCTDDVLVAFIERHANELAVQAVPQEPEDDGLMLLRLLIKSDVLNFGTFSKIINRFTRWSLTGISDVEEERVLLMIEKGMLHFQKKNTEDLLNNYSLHAVVAYLLKNKREFLSEPEKVEYTTEVALGLLKSGLSMTDKLAVISLFKKEILNEDLANEVIGVLRLNEIGLDFDFLIKVMSLSNKTTDKIVVLNYTLEKNDFDAAAITTLLNTLPGKYKEMAEKGKKPELPDTPETNRLVELLKEKDYISSFSKSKNGTRVNTKLK